MKDSAPSYETGELREFGEVLRGRRTINFYVQTPVPKKLVRAAIEAATWAPNHHVTEPWRFYLLGKETISACVELVRDIVTENKDANAGDFKAKAWAEKPGWLVVTCRSSDDAIMQREDYAACAASVHAFMLYLWKAGVGSKWTTGAIVEDKRLFDMLGVDQEQELVVSVLRYGYSKIMPTQSRKEVSDIVTELD